MLKWALIFAVISLIAGLFGFTGIAAGAAGIAKVLFVVALLIFLVLAATLALGLRHQAEVSDPTALPSPLVGREVPAFEAPVLTSAAPGGADRFQPAQIGRAHV